MSYKRMSIVILLVMVAFGSLAICRNGVDRTFTFLDEQEMLKEAGCEGCATTNCQYVGNVPCTYWEPSQAYIKKVPEDVTVSYCKSGESGGCSFSNPILCYTIYTCGSDETCTDCSTSPQYVPKDCAPL